VKAWRIEKKKRIATAATGEGARIAGGRWNSVGFPVVYASEHLSLAVLEILVHAPSPNQRMVARARSEIAIADGQVEVILPRLLPAGFGPATAYAETQAIGDEWLRTKRSVALRVPSAIVPSESNVLLNPAHPDFAKIVWSSFETINLDARLWQVK
jgi:RES domain-containing protein